MNIAEGASNLAANSGDLVKEAVESGKEYVADEL